MQWQENSIILSSKLFSENAKIVTVFNRSIGKTSGLVRGTKASIHAGDISNILWKGRTLEQLGSFRVENVFSPFTFAFNHPQEISAIESVCFLCHKGLPERAPHPKLFDSLQTLLLSISQKNWLINYALFEVNFLSEVGIGLSLSKCAVTGSSDNLYYVSPRTGCAVTEEVGARYKDRLFLLPKFLVFNDEYPNDYDIFCALQITGHFLKMYFNGINGGKLPPARDYLMAEVA